MKTFLHVGCGLGSQQDTLPAFQTSEWREVRLDIDPALRPDVVGPMNAMSSVSAESMDAVYSSHNVEHLYPHQVDFVLREFSRVLRPNGFAVITCPDLQAIAKMVVEGKLLDTAYVSPAGPVTPLDMIYGFRGATRAGNHFMAHRCGFTNNVLVGCLTAAGFKSVAGFTRSEQLALWAVARKDDLPEAEMRQFIQSLFNR